MGMKLRLGRPDWKQVRAMLRNPRSYVIVLGLAVPVALLSLLMWRVGAWLLMEFAAMVHYASAFAVVCLLLAIAVQVFGKKAQDKSGSSTEGESSKPPIRQMALKWILVAGAAAIAIGAELAVNLAASDIHDHMAEALPAANRLYANHDVAKLVGETLKVMTLKVCEEESDKETKASLKAIARVIPEEWLKLTNAQDSRVVPLTEKELWVFIQAPGALALNDNRWGGLVDEWVAAAQAAPLEAQPKKRLIKTLTTNFAFAWREALKHDYTHNGKASEAMRLDLFGELLRRTSETGYNDPDIRVAIAKLTEIPAELRSLADEVRLQTSGHAVAVIGKFDSVEGKLASIHRSVEAVKSEVHSIKENTNIIIAQGIATASALEKINTRLTKMENVMAALADKHAPRPGAAGPPPLDPEVREAALELVELGDKEERLVGSVALGDVETALSLLDELEKAPLASLFRLWTLRGDLWYGKGEFDKAIPSYELAWELRPDDYTATNNLALALIQGRLGDIAANQQRAIMLFQRNLKAVPQGSLDWAGIQNNLGAAWGSLLTGDRAENLHNANDCYENALQVFVRDDYPAEWAMAKNNLGVVWHDIPTGDHAENLQKAIGYYNDALQIYTPVNYPEEWASLQNRLGLAWNDKPTGDRAENLNKAIGYFNDALKVFLPDDFPADWATVQNNLGNVWSNFPTGNRAENLQKAIVSYSDALEVFNRRDFPVAWATIQNNLGNSWRGLPASDRAEKAANLHKAIDFYDETLQVYVPGGYPEDWAMTQFNRGLAFASLAAIQGNAERCGHLHSATRAIKGALTIYTKTGHPYEHTDTVKLLEVLLNEFLKYGCGDTAAFDDIPPVT